MDLFSTKIAKNKLNDSFKHIYKDPKLASVREVIQSWGRGLLQRNGESTKGVASPRTPHTLAQTGNRMRRRNLDNRLNLSIAPTQHRGCSSLSYRLVLLDVYLLLKPAFLSSHI